ncbi:MAG TPA: cyclic nucleotide-binding domain-containing protein [Mariprofundaceae bacterium]|nr:cyclic nucleotide-binding domain-containing protein [Mariprofundaceae bacterium]
MQPFWIDAIRKNRHRPPEAATTVRLARVKLLQSMPIFGGVTQETLEFLIDQATIHHLEPHEYFFHEGDRAISMFVLEKGKVVVSKKWNNRPHPVKHLGPGDCFGEMALLDLYPRSASVIAEEPCDAIELGREVLLNLSLHNLEQFAIIQMNIGREISRRLRTADDQLFRSKFGPAQ